ncbi:hypothetical protein [Streptomyces sp. NPDC096030]|uniref:hypothetical protein n=1 Tax=Streptomyces sp. NPDC096030 TaxID=3155423 RepID=UPI00332EF8F7
MQLDSRTQTPGGATASSSLYVEGTRWTRYSYMTDGPGIPGYSSGSLTDAQAEDLQQLVTSRELAHEQWLHVRIDCGNKPVTSWTLRTGSLAMSAPSCNGELPKLPVTFAKVTQLLSQATAPGQAG